MDKGINKRINNMKDSEPNEQSPLTCLTKRLMDVHIDTKYHVFTRKPTSLCVEDAIRKPSLSDSEDSVYFSAKSSQSYGDDDRTRFVCL
ncbi:hypothetical protein GJ496_004746 [Pomphorhynchus laevis]|nr:hypothetical protein GJ496_004746 [Pomphorhynchus laevis]